MFLFLIIKFFSYISGYFKFLKNMFHYLPIREKSINILILVIILLVDQNPNIEFTKKTVEKILSIIYTDYLNKR